jgi:putative NADPH-quinone reductase
MKKILIINGHPDQESFCFSLAESYKKGALETRAEIKEIIIRDLHFNPNLQFGYRQRTELEDDLLEAWDKIKWADHLVWVYPVWWGGVPAIMKGFIDRLFLPGLAFRKKEGSLIHWDKLLKGKTARIISTLDQPVWYYWLVYREPSNNAMKKLVLQFCGVSPVKVTTFGPIRLSTETYRRKRIEKVKHLGKGLK